MNSEILILVLFVLIGTAFLGYLIDYRQTLESIKKNKKYYQWKLVRLFKSEKVKQREYERRREKLY